MAAGYYSQRDAVQSSSDLYTADLNEEASLWAPTDQPGPKAVVMTGEADLSCDGDEAHASSLHQAGALVIAVRCQAITQDVAMLKAQAVNAAVTPVIDFQRDAHSTHA